MESNQTQEEQRETRGTVSVIERSIETRKGSDNDILHQAEKPGRVITKKNDIKDFIFHKQLVEN